MGRNNCFKERTHNIAPSMLVCGSCIKKLHFIMVIKKAQCFYKLDDTEQKNVFKYSLSGEAGSIG